MSNQPKDLTELVFSSFTTFMEEGALELLEHMKVSLPSLEVVTKTCEGLKDFFHGTRLPSVLANEITKRLLTKLTMFSAIFVTYEYTRKDYIQQILLSLVEVILHPDVTSIELGPGYLYETGYDYCNFILTTILMKVGCLQNLKILSLGFGINIRLKHGQIVFPAQLRQLTLCGSLCLRHKVLKSVVECCRELKSLKIVRCSNIHINVPDILKLKHLETLHLLREFSYGYDEDCAALINGISTDPLSDVLSASTLKSFGIAVREEDTLRLIVDKLPHLTEIVLKLGREFDLSCLTQLKNLRSLTLDATGRSSDNYKKILPVLGKSLVSLDLRSYYSLDLEFIGETCGNLQYLHVCTTAEVETRPKPSFSTFPNFRSVEYLKIKMTQDYDWIEFIIVQCLNIKVLSVVSASQPTIIENVLKRTSLTNLEEIHWYPEVKADDSCLKELCLKCPNVRLVHGLGFDSFISRKAVFDFYGCRKSFCETYCYSLDILNEIDDSYCYSCDSYCQCGSFSTCTSDSEST